MKWGWKRARRSAVLPVTGPLSSLWRLPLLDSQRHCWTSSLIHSLAYTLLFWSPGPLLLSQMGKSFTMSCSADTPLTTTLVSPRCSSTRISQALIRMKHSNHTPFTSIRYGAVCIVVCSCFRNRITANTGFLVFIRMANKQELNFMTINDICSYTTLKNRIQCLHWALTSLKFLGFTHLNCAVNGSVVLNLLDVTWRDVLFS